MVTGSEVVQLNVRLPRELRDAGDRALANIGMAPSRAIRRLWEKAARGGDDLEEVADFLSDDNARSVSGGNRFETLERGWSIVEDGMKAMGSSMAVYTAEHPTDRELLEEALRERMRERGVI